VPDDGSTVIKGMRNGYLGLYPRQAVLFQRQRAEKWRGHTERVNGGANVMSEPGQGELCGAGPSASGVCAFDYQNPSPRLTETHCGGQPVGPGTDNDGIDFAHLPRVRVGKVLQPVLTKCLHCGRWRPLQP
jgi:hypothetical protein